MIKFLIHRPISVVVLVFALLCLSFMASRQLEVSLLPDIGIPEITILVDAPSYAPLEVEQKILFPMRRYLNAINGLQDLSCSAGWGLGQLHLRFDYGRDVDKVFIETNEMVDLSMNSLPAGIERPRVIKTRAEDLPVYYLTLKYNTDYQEGNFLQLSEYAKEVLRRRLEQLPGVALVDVHGVKNMQVAISPDENRLLALGLTQEDLQKALQDNQINFNSTIIKERQYQYLVRIGKSITGTKEIQNVRLVVGSRIVKIGDLAQVGFEEQTATGSFEDDGQPAISLAIIKNPGASLNDLETNLHSICQEIQEERPDIKISITRDQTKLLRFTLNNLKTSLFSGCLLAIGIVFFFYSQWRIPILIGIIIPISLLISLLFFKGLGLSLNMISLSGLLLGLGMMIDNGIIVLDNISQEWIGNVGIEEACIKGTNEMITPLLTSMLTTCSVFFPLFMISGIAGALFWDQALAVSVGLVTSYLVSITLLPTLYFGLLKNRRVENIQKSTLFTRSLTRLYNRGFNFTFRYPGLILVAIGLFIFLACLASIHLPLARFPTLPEEAFEVNIDWNAPIQPEISAQRIDRIFEKIEAPWQAHIGVSQYLLNALYQGEINGASIYVKIPVQEDPDTLKSNIRQRLHEFFPEARISFTPEKTPFEMLFPTPDQTIILRCFIDGHEEDAAQNIYQKIFQEIKELPGIQDIYDPDYDKTYFIQPDLQKLMYYNVDENHLIAELKKMLGEHKIMELKSFQYSVPVVIKGDWTGIEEIRQKGQVENRQGTLIPMHQLIDIHASRSMRKILASKAGRFWPIWIHTLQPERIEKHIAQIERQFPSLKIEIDGSYKANKLLISEIIRALLVSLLLLYFLLTAQFESFLQPFIVLLEIPISLSGALVFLWMFGATINMMSLIGMVVTMGIVINDSIIKVDTINRLRRAGLSVKEALHQGGLKRINPITMTSLTTILAVVPFFWGSDWGNMLQRPLAISLVGSMLVGTIVSLYIIPLLYFWIYKNQEK